MKIQNNIYNNFRRYSRSFLKFDESADVRDSFAYFYFHGFLIHQQVIASKRLITKDKLQKIVEIAFKFLFYLRECLQTSSLPIYLDKGQPELLFHSDVRWLRTSKFLQQFYNL